MPPIELLKALRENLQKCASQSAQDRYTREAKTMEQSDVDVECQKLTARASRLQRELDVALGKTELNLAGKLRVSLSDTRVHLRAFTEFSLARLDSVAIA